MIDRARVDTICEWLVSADDISEPADVIAHIGRELVAAGVPLERFAAFVTTLHPTVVGRRYQWNRGDAETTLGRLTLAGQREPGYRNSPVGEVTETGREMRRRLTDPAAAADYAILASLAREGFTDYLALPLKFLSGELHAVSFASKAPGGFDDAHLDAVRRVCRPLTRVFEVLALRRVAGNLLGTYVGRDAGERVLAGRIVRGDVDTLRAVIWFSDLRGFTRLSEQLSPSGVVAVLNEVFDCQVPAIQERGGDVLKFIGDGLLALFPIAGAASIEDVGARALAAADAAFAALDARNASKPPPPATVGVALHVGEVAYGNIGGADRLDFTAIGAAVNLAARLEGLTSRLGERLLVSAELAGAVAAKRALVDVGEFELKGVADKQRVFAPER